MARLKKNNNIFLKKKTKTRKTRKNKKDKMKTL